MPLPGHQRDATCAIERALLHCSSARRNAEPSARRSSACSSVSLSFITRTRSGQQQPLTQFVEVLS